MARHGASQEVMAWRGVERVDALYTETIESSLLATSLTSEGRIEYWAPSRIRKHLTPAIPSR